MYSKPVSFNSPLYLLLLCFICLPFVVHAEPAASKDNKTSASPASNELNVESIDTKIKALNDKQELTDLIKSKILARYEATKENLENLARYKAQTAQYQTALQSAPLKIKNLQADIARNEANLKEVQTESFQSIPTDELEQRYILEQGSLSTLDDEIKQLDNAIQVQNNRPQQIRTETVTAKLALEAAQKALIEFLQGTEAKVAAEASQLQLKTLIDTRSAELKMIEFESISHDSRSQLLKIQHQALTLKRSLLEPVINSIEEQLAIRRQLEANKVNEELSQAEKDSANKPLVIQNITRENIKYSRDLQALTLKLEQYNTQKALADQQTATIQADYKSAEKKISLAGLSPALGKILREQHRNLNFKDEFFLQTEALQNETANTSLEQFKEDEQLKKLDDIDRVLNQLTTEQVDANLPANQRLRIKAELRVLLNTQKELLSKLSGLYVNYLRILGDVDFARQQLLAQANQYARYLDTRLLWVPSSLPINETFLKDCYQSSRWLLSPHNGLILTKDTLKTFVNHPFLGLIALVSLGVLYFFSHKIKTLMANLHLQVARPSTDHFKHTVKCLGYTLILVAPLALFLNYLGWFLSQDMRLSQFTKAVGTGLRAAAIPLFFLQFYYHLFHPEGIVRKHFAWRKKPIAVLRQQFGLLTYSIVPTTFIIAMTGAYEDLTHTDTLGRLALIISLFTIGSVLGTVFQAKTELFPRSVSDNPQHWLMKYRVIWYPAIISIPFIIMGFAVSGYYLSALELQEKFITTLRIAFSAVVVHELGIRWLSLVNRQLAIRNALQLSSVQQEQMNGNPAPDTAAHLPEDLIDIPSVNAQTIQIFNVIIVIGLLLAGWVIWKNILPAFAFLDQVVLWQHQVLVDAKEVYQPVTLTNLIFSSVYAFIAYITVSNLPGLMELVVFRRFEIEPGSRYAVNQLGKYLLLSMTFIRIADELGGRWSQVQWLAAALGVGLGFGLQEIFANLVSGIILLFERPIRVGDTVTVGTITGTVNRIQMRATNLIDGDRKELIVPNKTFITNQLINWTLTDATTRIVVPISIAYGVDIILVHRIMLDAVKSIPQVLETPVPSVLLTGFVDGALSFSIRYYVGKLADRPASTHALHLKLYEAFREQQISMPVHREMPIQDG